MRKIMLLSLAILFLASAAATAAAPRLQLAMTKPEAIALNAWEDDSVAFVFAPGPKQIEFSLKNKTTGQVKIIWDQTVFIDSRGNSGGVIHAGVRFIDAANSKPPTLVPPNVRTTDLVSPVSHIRYSSGWQQDGYVPSLFGVISKSAQGMTVGVQFALEINGELRYYPFEFTVI